MPTAKKVTQLSGNYKTPFGTTRPETVQLMKTLHLIHGMALRCLVARPEAMMAAEATNATTAPAAAAPAPGARRGGNNRGAPMTDAEKAEVAKLMELPTLTAGAGDGDY